MLLNTALILGADPRVGSRKPDIEKATKAGSLPITVDLTSTQSVEEAFAQATKDLGIPNVVVYNAAAITLPKDLKDPFGSVDLQAFTNDFTLNTVEPYVSIREAVKGFEKLSADAPKAFIVTGNVLQWQLSPIGVTLGTGKAALARLINIGAGAYKEKNFRFYFASQVTDRGKTAKNADLNGPAHGAVYWELTTEKEQGDWDVRFLGDGKIVQAK